MFCKACLQYGIIIQRAVTIHWLPRVQLSRMMNLKIDFAKNKSSNGCHSGPKIFKPEKNLEFFRLKILGPEMTILVGLSD